MKLNEGQTQVYMDGRILPRYGVNEYPAMYNPPKQLLDLTREFFKSSKTPAQVLSILVGMGTDQKMAECAIHCIMNEYKTFENKKSTQMIDFTLIKLYEKINKTVKELEMLKREDGRSGFAIGSALSSLTEKMNAYFPDKEILDTIIESESEVKEESNPLHKFTAMYEFYNIISNSSADLIPVKELKEYMDSVYESNIWSFKIYEAIKFISSRNDAMHNKLAEELTAIIESDNIKEDFKKVAVNNAWSHTCKSILSEMRAAENLSTDQPSAKVITLFSPVLENGGSVSFNLYGKDYRFDGKSIRESEVTDSTYKAIVEALGYAKMDENSISFTGENGAHLVYNLSEETVTLGDSDISESNGEDLQKALISTKFYTPRNYNFMKSVCTLHENLDMIAEMDNFLNLSSQEFLGVFLTMISVEEGVWVNMINPSMKLNELKFFDTATEALKEAKEFIKYDATVYLSEMLKEEDNKNAIIESKRSVINSEIDFLEENKTKLLEAINRIGKTEELDSALKMIENEIKSKEVELQSTYLVEAPQIAKAKFDTVDVGRLVALSPDGQDEVMKVVKVGDDKKLKVIRKSKHDMKHKVGDIVEPKSEVWVLKESTKDDYLDNGYVEVTVEKDIPQLKLKKGQEILVNAEEYASMGDDNMIDIFIPKTKSDRVVMRGDLKIKI